MILATDLLGWSTDKWQAMGAIGSVIAAVGAIWVAWKAYQKSGEQTKFIKEQLDLQDRHNRLSVRPSLLFVTTEGDLVLKNAGIGPAFIKKVTLRRGEIEINLPERTALTDAKTQEREMLSTIDANMSRASLPFNGEVMSIGAVENVYWYSAVPCGDYYEEKSIATEVSLVIEYESMYGDKFACRWN